MRLIIASPSQGFVKMYIKLFKPCLAHGRNYVNAGYYYFMLQVYIDYRNYEQSDSALRLLTQN